MARLYADEDFPLPVVDELGAAHPRCRDCRPQLGEPVHPRHPPQPVGQTLKEQLESNGLRTRNNDLAVVALLDEFAPELAEGFHRIIRPE
jgi:hypothetical protein